MSPRVAEMAEGVGSPYSESTGVAVLLVELLLNLLGGGYDCTLFLQPLQSLLEGCNPVAGCQSCRSYGFVTAFKLQHSQQR